MINETLTLVKVFEGKSYTAYLCPAMVWTIGYGTTRYPGGMRVKEGEDCTDKEAERYLMHELEYAMVKVLQLTTVELNPYQLGALISFVYNLGAGAFRASTLRRRINNHEFDDVPYQLSRWVNGGGRRLKGLVRRRAAEIELWGMYG